MMEFAIFLIAAISMPSLLGVGSYLLVFGEFWEVRLTGLFGMAVGMIVQQSYITHLLATLV